MKGCDIKYKRLGVLLKEARERAGMSLADAAMLIGLTNKYYLWRCEDGRWANFPAAKLKRAMDLYSIGTPEVVLAITEDYKEGMIDFLQRKED